VAERAAQFRASTEASFSLTFKTSTAAEQLLLSDCTRLITKPVLLAALRAYVVA
jgi:hypothetical protein